MSSKTGEKKWIEDTALVFYQIFSEDYSTEEFEQELLKGGGGNSTLCSTWIQLSDKFIKYRISKTAYETLITKIKETDRSLIKKEDNCVTIPYNFIDKKNKYKHLFSSNNKSLKKRQAYGQLFHLDHNPSNKKMLTSFKNEVKKNQDKEKAIKKLSKNIKNTQTIDIITIKEDEIRTKADRESKEKLNAKERDKLLNTEFYDVILTK